MTVTPTRVKPGDHPTIDRLVGRAKRHLRRHVPHACKHAGTGPLFLCGQHPAAGVLCLACMRAHADRHAHTVEHGCDLCGAIDDDFGLRCFIAGIDGVGTVRNPRRGAALLAGRLHIVSMGLCPSCYEAGER